MPAYVTLPGTSGNYFDTPTVNLLRSDTANIHQDLGTWAAQGAGTGLTLSTAMTPAFGSNHGAITSNNSQAAVVRSGPPNTGATPTPSSTEITWSVALSSDTASRWAVVYLYEYTSAGSLIGTLGNSGAQALTVGSWTRVGVTATTSATCAYTRVIIAFTSDSGGSTPADNGDIMYFDAAIARAGTSTTFLPSLRLVNDLEIEWKVALDDYTPAATNTILDCLNSNDGYRIRHTTGDLIEIAYGDGSSTRAQTSSATGLTDGNDHVFKVTVDQSTGAVVYYIDGVQHDTDTMTTGAGSPDINDLVVGANAAASANWTDGDIYYVTVRDGIDGPVVARFDADDWVGI